jgi:hypothetical protein
MFRNSFDPAPIRGAGNFRLFVFLWVALVIFGVVGVVTGARAHGGYPVECCHDRDCAPIDPKAVRVTPEGWDVTLGPDDHAMLAEAGLTQRRTWSIPRAAGRKPLSGDYHICFSPTGSLLCFFPKADGG